MKNIIFLVIVLFGFNNMFAATDAKVNIQCVEPESTVQIIVNNSVVETFKGNGLYKYTADASKTILIKMILDGGEYIIKPYKLIVGEQNNLCMGLANIAGFYNSDRERLNKTAAEVIKKLQDKSGTMKEIEAWLSKAIKDIQKNPKRK